ncbi:MAG: DsbC family protein [Rhodocyclaceae bacterium]|nr:DsbC family protein [Rhodocyclaceae bacterium]
MSASRRSLSLACLLALPLFASAALAADDADVKKAVEPVLQQLFGPTLKVDGVRKAGMLGLYEIQIGGEILYSDEKGSYLIRGEILDVKAKKNITEERKNKLAQIKFSDLPLDLAVKTVRGSGKRVFATFEDPNCGYCKKLAKDMGGMTDFTMYTFLLPILGGDSPEKTKAIWCAQDKSKAWMDWMVNNTSPAAAGANCNVPMDKLMALGQKLNVRGTPTIFLSDGSRIPGAVPAAQLEQALNQVGK